MKTVDGIQGSKVDLRSSTFDNRSDIDEENPDQDKENQSDPPIHKKRRPSPKNIQEQVLSAIHLKQPVSMNQPKNWKNHQENSDVQKKQFIKLFGMIIQHFENADEKM